MKTLSQLLVQPSNSFQGCNVIRCQESRVEPGVEILVRRIHGRYHIQLSRLGTVTWERERSSRCQAIDVYQQAIEVHETRGNMGSIR